jgi:hypothetical protein
MVVSGRHGGGGVCKTVQLATYVGKKKNPVFCDSHFLRPVACVGAKFGFGTSFFWPDVVNDPARNF